MELTVPLRVTSGTFYEAAVSPPRFRRLFLPGRTGVLFGVRSSPALFTQVRPLEMGVREQISPCSDFLPLSPSAVAEPPAFPAPGTGSRVRVPVCS